MSVTVCALNVYPVKSMRGISLDCSQLLPTGMSYDRSWMVVDPTGRFLTQRELPRLALIETVLESTGVKLKLGAQDEIELPFEAIQGDKLKTAVWGDTCEVIDQGPEISAWLTQSLESKRPLRMVRMLNGYRRPQSRGERYGEKTSTIFADGAPYLVANESSLDRLNDELERRGLQSVSMNRFRPNIVLRGMPAFTECNAGDMIGPGYTLRLCYPCERCVITTIDQDTGIPSPDRQPFKTLAEINPMPGNPRAPAFAENATLISSANASINLGDEVTLRPL